MNWLVALPSYEPKILQVILFIRRSHLVLENRRSCLVIFLSSSSVAPILSLKNDDNFIFSLNLSFFFLKSILLISSIKNGIIFINCVLEVMSRSLANGQYTTRSFLSNGY